MKKILILYGAYGGGHLSAAKTISSYFEENYKDEVEVKVVDCIEYINKYINKVSTEAYKELAKAAPWAWKRVYNDSQSGPLSHISTATNKLMSRKLFSLIDEYQPDLIISTHPFATQMCGNLKKRGKINTKLATILTDYHIHEQWLVFSEYNDLFFVSNDQMKKDMVEKSIPAEKIHVTGIPVSNRFLKKYNKDEIYESLGLSPDRKTVLFFAGGEFGLGRNSTVMTLKVLIRLFRQLQVVAISGKNKRMNKKFKELVASTNSEDRIKVIEFSNQIPEIMSIASSVITKAGGLTITECLISNLPIVIINPIPGQEEENAEFLVENNVAMWIKKDDSIARKLKGLSKDLDRLNEMKENTKLLAKPDSTKNICEIAKKEIS